MSQTANRTEKDFANDFSLYHRLKRSVEVLANGQGAKNKRFEVVKCILRPLRAEDFPDELRKEFEVIEKMLAPDSEQRRPTLKNFSATLVRLYGEICAARGRYTD